MAKKNKEDALNPNSVPNRDIIQRLNFLYQASSYLSGLGAANSRSAPSNAAPNSTAGKGRCMEKKVYTSSGEANSSDDDTREPSGRRRATVHDLARTYVKSMKAIGQKTNVKMDPTVKRTMCKGCNMLLMSGVTAKVRVKPLPSHGHAINYTCTNCTFSRRIPAPPMTEPTAELPVSQTGAESTETSQRMDVDPVDALLNKVKERVSVNAVPLGKRAQLRNRRKRKTVKPHPMPFFDRPGHILFVGNDRIDQNSEYKTDENREHQNGIRAY